MLRSFSTPTAQIVLDACLEGFGGYLVNKSYYEGSWSNEIKNHQLSISSLECLNCLYAVRQFQDQLKGQTVLLWCNNKSTVSSLMSGKARDPVIAGVLREMWKICVSNDIHLIVEHRSGEQMLVPDILSRKHRGKAEAAKCRYLSSIINGKQIRVSTQHQKLPECSLSKASKID